MTQQTNLKPFKTVTLTTYDKLSLTSDSHEFSVPESWLEKILLAVNETVEDFLSNYTWDDSQAIKDLAISDKVYISLGEEEEFMPEWCPNCEEEVELPINFVVHDCPNCLESILPCNQCDEVNCANCPLRKDLIISKLTKELEDILERTEEACELMAMRFVPDRLFRINSLIDDAKKTIKK